MTQKFKFVDIESDGLVRTISATYEDLVSHKQVSFKTPNFAVPLRTSPRINMPNIRLQLDHLLTEHTRFYVTKIYDVDTAIINRLSRVTQQDLNGNYPDQAFGNFFSSNIMILDFALESLEYANALSKYARTGRLPREIRDLSHLLSDAQDNATPREFREIRARGLEGLWDSILSDSRTLYDFEGRVFDEGLKAYGDIILPATKLIRTKSDLSDVKKINETWLTMHRIHEKQLVVYLLLHPSVLRNYDVVLEIIEYIESLRGIDILALKIKNLDLTGGSNHALPRENLKAILKSIVEKKKQNKNLLTVVLEAGEQFWPFSLQSFDVVSTSASMYDKTGGGKTINQGYGKAIDEHSLALVEYELLQREFDRVGFFPCSHNFCKERIQTMDKDLYHNYEWANDSRCHNMLVLDGWMQGVSEAVSEKEVDVAFSRLDISPVRVLKELLLPNYDTDPYHPF